jgi:UDP-2,4-diacetamido-2,4,6-trideoxy-beta-L-altropyranose hydrolase
LNIIQENKQINRSHHVEIPQPRQESRLHYGDPHIDRLSKNANLSCKFHIHYEFERVNVNFVFKANSSSAIGSGHFIRSLNLGLALQERNHEIFFAYNDLLAAHQNILFSKGISSLKMDLALMKNSGNTEADEIESFINNQGLLNVDWIIVDDYGTDGNWDLQMRRISNKLMVIEDLHFSQRNCDILLDMNYRSNDFMKSVNAIYPKSMTLVGPEYALLDSFYAKSRSNFQFMDIDLPIIMLYFGSNDEFSLTLRSLKILLQAFPKLHIRVIILDNNVDKREISTLANAHKNTVKLFIDPPSLGEIADGCEISIGAGGISLWERFSLGIFCLCFATADNQCIPLEELAQAGSIDYLGYAEFYTETKIKESLDFYLANRSDLIKIRIRNKILCDGNGVERVIRLIMEKSQ